MGMPIMRNRLEKRAYGDIAILLPAKKGNMLGMVQIHKRQLTSTIAIVTPTSPFLSLVKTGDDVPAGIRDIKST